MAKNFWGEVLGNTAALLLLPVISVTAYTAVAINTVTGDEKVLDLAEGILSGCQSAIDTSADIGDKYNANINSTLVSATVGVCVKETYQHIIPIPQNPNA